MAKKKKKIQHLTLYMLKSTLTNRILRTYGLPTERENTAVLPALGRAEVSSEWRAA